MEITPYKNINKKNIIFNPEKEYRNKSITYKRIPIEINYSKTKKGPLIIETPFLFSFGVSESKISDKVNGYSIPVCLWSNGEKPKTSEQSFYDVIKLIKNLCEEHLDGKYGEITLPLYYKKIEKTDRKGKKKTIIDESSAPILYTKLIYSDKSKKFLSLFKGNKGEDLNPLKYINFKCRVKLALTIEGIYIGDKTTSLQIKVYECRLKELPARKSLICTNDEDEDEDEDEV